jgi:isopentenyldiphosphate isomerase
LYYADADERFAEYELDYIIFTKMNSPQFQFNTDEVQATRFVSQEELETIEKK